MIIPEEQLVTDIIDLLNNELPAVLLSIEEESSDGKRLLPFRYVGEIAKLPVGTGFPYAIVEVEEGLYTEKDRIIKNVTYRVTITLKIAEYSLVWHYYAGIKRVVDQTNLETWRIHIDNTNRFGVMNISLVKC